MGQYYKPINTDDMSWFYAHEVDNNGLKLMEHSYIGNMLCGAVMFRMTKGQPWYMKPIVWAGDYYDEAGEIPYYKMVQEKIEPKEHEYLSMADQHYCFIVNHTKREYYDCSKTKEIEGWKDCYINPLPLLTALGNDRGGGDYRGKSMDKVGAWAGDILSISLEEDGPPVGYEEVNYDFKEE